MEVAYQGDGRRRGVVHVGQAHLPHTVPHAVLHVAHHPMRDAVGRPGTHCLLGVLRVAREIAQFLQADAFVVAGMTGSAGKVHWTKPGKKQGLAHHPRLFLLGVIQRRIDLHPVGLQGDVEGEDLEIGIGPVELLTAIRLGLDLGLVEALQRDHTGDDARLEVLHLVGILEVTRQFGESALEHAGAFAEVAFLQGSVLRPALLLEQGLSAVGDEGGGVGELVLQGSAIFVGGLELLGRYQGGHQQRYPRGQGLQFGHGVSFAPTVLCQPDVLIRHSDHTLCKKHATFGWYAKMRQLVGCS